MASIKKAQKGSKVPKGYVQGEMTGRMIPEKEFYARRDSASKSLQKAVGVKKKMKDGGKSFPDLNKDGKITKADILKGRGVIKNGGKLKKAKSGAALKKQAATAIAMKKADKSPKKAMGGMKMMKGGGKCKYGC
jgi:hypothetical protein